jgi:hypothetical protein
VSLRRTPFRACGKPWSSAEEALRSKRALADETLEAQPCSCGGWHLKSPERPRAATPARPRRDTGPSAETRAMVYARDLGCCVRCGVAAGNIPHSCHHRSRRAQLGLNEASNLITLCGSGVTGCHGWVHGHVAEAEDAGYLVRSGFSPAAIPVTVATPDGPRLRYLTDDFQRARKRPEGVSAA